MTSKKTKILANWCYDREDITNHLHLLSDSIEWVFLYKYEKDTNDQQYNFTIVYWNDFKNPYELLEKIKPDKILFHDIESFHQVSLNIAAKNTKTTTFVLEHGMRGAYEIEVALQKRNNGTIVHNDQKSNIEKNNTLYFYLSAIRLKNIFSIANIFRFAIIRRKYGLTLGLYKCKFKLREADLYINFTMHNASYILKRDGIAESKIKNIGNPYFDKFFGQYQEQEIKQENSYFLLIDAPYCEQNYFVLDKEQKIKFYKRLNNYCLTKNKKIIIKLHPLMYKSTYLPIDKNIQYIREGNIEQLVKNASGCFMINFSTLSPLVMYYAPTVYFNTGINDFDMELINSNILPIHNFFDFKETEIYFTELNSEVKKSLINKYLYSIDGKSNQRLKQILIS